ncbi:MAG TPA: hemerythrin domain-containing protein [Candidatus Eisenbacteria bacterium]|nr:hemerythrin domain-containing protein [Candidatus Eisenbacteria bacterium]
MGEPDILQRMRRDHEQVLADVDVLERAAAGVGHERERNLRVVVTGFERQFHTHMSAEDELLFPALLESLPETAAQVSSLVAEHHELRRMLEQLLHTLDQPASPARHEQLGVQSRDLADLLRIHIRREEAIVFRLAEPVLGPRVREALEMRLVGPPATRASSPGKETTR